VSGVFAAWRQVGWSIDAYRHTTYGLILVSKLAVFVGLLALASWSRRILHTRRPASLSAAVATEATLTSEPLDRGVHALRWSVGAELMFGIAVLVITSMLVNSQPARSALSLPFSKTFHEPTMQLNLIVAPAKAGPVDIHVYALTPSGTNLYTPSITATMSLPSKGIAPITIPLVRAGPNHFLACQSELSSTTGPATCTAKFSIPFPGNWLVTIRALRTEFDEVAVDTNVDIR
jgi:copper transport protein